MKTRNYESTVVELKNEVSRNFPEEKQPLDSSGGKITNYVIFNRIIRETKSTWTSQPVGLRRLFTQK